MTIAKTECDACHGTDRGSGGRCTRPGPDGHVVQCVGAWAEDKHEYLRKYFDATRAVRKDYLAPKGRGGAAFVDLFAGPGMVRVRDTGQFQDGSPMIAAKHEAAPFSKLVLCDLDLENVRALRARTAEDPSRVTVVEGDCNAKVADVLAEVPPYGLNIALVDPFGLSALKFATLERLAAMKRMDLVIHFPWGDIKRNLFQHESSKLHMDEAMGSGEWRKHVHGLGDVARLVDLFRGQLQLLGYTDLQIQAEPIKNNQNVTLYYLVYASKHARGDAIWKSIIKNTAGGQRGFGFD